MVAMSNRWSPSPKQVRIEAGRQIYVSAIFRHVYATSSFSPGYAMTSESCTGVASFAPIAGHEYRLTQVHPPFACKIEVTDVATGSAPPDLMERPVQATCAPVKPLGSN